jgi:hypothetical protein
MREPVTAALLHQPPALLAAAEETNVAALVLSFGIAGAIAVAIAVTATRIQRSRETKAIGPLAFTLERRRRATPPHMQGTMEKATWTGVHGGRAVEVSTLQVPWRKTFNRVSVATTIVAGSVDPPAAVFPGHYPARPAHARVGWHGHDSDQGLHELGAPEAVEPLRQLASRGLLTRPSGRRAAVIRSGDELHVAIAADLHEAVEILVLVADALALPPGTRISSPTGPVSDR